MTAREQVLAAIADLLDEDVGAPRDEVELDAIGIDSLGRWMLLVELEDRLGLDGETDIEFKWTTVGDVVAWAERAMAEKSKRSLPCTSTMCRRHNRVTCDQGDSPYGRRS